MNEHEHELILRKQENRALFNKIQNKLSNFIKDHNKTSFFEHVNYGPEELKNHFENCFRFYSPLFKMSWKNYGDWQVDHFAPRSHDTFQTGEEQVRISKCFAKENLRPLPSWYNNEKGSFYIKDKRYYSWNRIGPLTERSVYGRSVYREKRKPKKILTTSQIRWYETQYVKFLNNEIQRIRIKY